MITKKNHTPRHKVPLPDDEKARQVVIAEREGHSWQQWAAGILVAARIAAEEAERKLQERKKKTDEDQPLSNP